MSFPSPEDKAREAVDHFLEARPTKEEIEASIRFHKAGALSLGEMEGDRLSITEIVERITIAERAQAIIANASGSNPDSTYEPLKLNLAHLAFFLCGGKEKLYHLLGNANALELCLRSLEPFLKMTLQKSTDKPLDHLRPPTVVPQPVDDKKDPSYEPGVKTDEHGNRTKERTRSAADTARQRDQCCVVTGCPLMEVCHLMPFSANNTPRRHENLRIMLTNIMWPMLHYTDWERIQQILMSGSGDLASSDKSFNLLCLEFLTHKSLDKGYWAFEWIGLSNEGELDCQLGETSYKTVQLRFHWLPDCIADALGESYLHKKTARKGDTGRLLKIGDASNRYTIATAIHEQLTNTSKISSHGVTLARNNDFRPLVTGHIVPIRVAEEDLDKTRLMIQFQWFALNMVAISGAAEAVDDLDSEPPRSPDELPTYCGIPEIETDESEDVDLPLDGQSFPMQRRRHCVNMRDAGPAPAAEAGPAPRDEAGPAPRDEAGPAPRDEAELEATLSPTLRNDSPPADNAKRPKD